MNNARRKIIEEAMSNLRIAQDEEQDAFDNMPENFQDGERGERAQEAIDALEEAIEAAERALE